MAENSSDQDDQKIKQVNQAGQLRSYLLFLRTNPKFRQLWGATIVSQVGDWFNYIAIFVLLNDLTGSGQAVSWFLVAKFLPTTLLGPVAGVVADRFSRKKIMVGCDLLRGVVVLGYLYGGQSSQVWCIYLLAFLQESIWTFNHPARQAAIPDVCAKEDLNLANGLFGATWSINLAVGAALGGFVTAWFGWEKAIILDALTFCGSAFLISRVPLIARPRKKTQLSLARITGLTSMIEGFRYVQSVPQVRALLFVKSGWALSGGIIVMLTIFGEQVFADGGRGGLSGVLFSMRGLGAAIGPFLAWRFFGSASADMKTAICASFFISAIAYLLFSQAPNIVIAGFFVLLGHIGGSIQWVFSTALLQVQVDERFRGRVFAAEMGLLTLIMSLSTIVTGQALDMGFSPRRIVVVLAILFLVPGTLWCTYVVKGLRSGAGR